MKEVILRAFKALYLFFDNLLLKIKDRALKRAKKMKCTLCDGRGHEVRWEI